MRSAIVWTNKLLKLDPKHARARGNIPHYQKTLNEERERLRIQRRGVCVVFLHYFLIIISLLKETLNFN